MDNGSVFLNPSKIGIDLGAGISVTILRNLVLIRGVFFGLSANCLDMILHRSSSHILLQYDVSVTNRLAALFRAKRGRHAFDYDLAQIVKLDSCRQTRDC